MAPVVQALSREAARAESVVCVTAQHRGMLDQVLAVFGITPDIDLDLMRPDQNTGDLGAAAFTALNGVLDRVQPDVVLVQGDTTTATIAALASFYRRIPVGHIEAGLRTGDPEHPFPEEINRRLADVVSRFRFAPTPSAARALRAEHHPPRSIITTGNTVVDALRHVLARPLLAPLPVDPREPYILVTCHRRELFGTPLMRVCNALATIARRRPDHTLVFPVHPNPNVQRVVRERLGAVAGIRLVDPLPYDAFVHLMAGARLIITDSGGIQEEAPALGVPVVVVREKTERPEAVAAGAAVLAGTATRTIVAAVLARLTRARRIRRNLFGDGRAATRIVRHVLRDRAVRARAAART